MPDLSAAVTIVREDAGAGRIHIEGAVLRGEADRLLAEMLDALRAVAALLGRDGSVGWVGWRDGLRPNDDSRSVADWISYAWSHGLDDALIDDLAGAREPDPAVAEVAEHWLDTTCLTAVVVGDASRRPPAWRGASVRTVPLDPGDEADPAAPLAPDDVLSPV